MFNIIGVNSSIINDFYFPWKVLNNIKYAGVSITICNQNEKLNSVGRLCPYFLVGSVWKLTKGLFQISRLIGHTINEYTDCNENNMFNQIVCYKNTLNEETWKKREVKFVLLTMKMNCNSGVLHEVCCTEATVWFLGEDQKI